MLRHLMQPNAVYQYPLWGVAFVMLGTSVVGAALLQKLVGRFVSARLRRRHNPITGAVIAVVGVTYAVLLAFVAMLAWDAYGAAEVATDHEAAELLDVAQTAGGLAQPTRSQLLTHLVAYGRAVQDVEWPEQAEGHVSEAGEAPLNRATDLVLAMHPSDLGESNVQAALLADITHLRDARTTRIAAAEAAVPGIVWIVVIAGGALTLAFTALLGAWADTLHIVLTSLLALSGALVLVMIVALGHPFRGDYRVRPKPFSLAIMRMEMR